MKPIQFYSIEDLPEPLLALVPLMSHMVSAGFPSNTDDHVEECINLHRELIRNPSASLIIRIWGHSMVEANISNGDIVILDKSEKAQNGSIILATINGEQTIKVYKKVGDRIFLVPRAKGYPTIEIQPYDDFLVEGVITYIIYNAKKNNSGSGC